MTWQENYKISPEEFVALCEQLGTNDELRVLGHLIEAGQIPENDYVQWASQEFMRPYVNEGFFQKFLFNEKHISELLSLYPEKFSPYCMPLFSWDGTWTIATLLNFDESSWPLPVACVIAPASQLRQLWEKIKVAPPQLVQLEEPIAPKEESVADSESPPSERISEQFKSEDSFEASLASMDLNLILSSGRPPESVEVEPVEGLMEASAEIAPSWEEPLLISKEISSPPEEVPAPPIEVKMEAPTEAKPEEAQSKTSFTNFKFDLANLPASDLPPNQPEKENSQPESEFPEGFKLELKDDSVPSESGLTKMESLETPLATPEDTGPQMPEGLNFGSLNISDSPEAPSKMSKDVPIEPTPLTSETPTPTLSGLTTMEPAPVLESTSPPEKILVPSAPMPVPTPTAGAPSQKLPNIPPPPPRKDPLSPIFNRWLEKFDRAMLLIRSSGSLTPYKWLGPWENSDSKLERIDISKRSIFRIVCDSGKPYFGYVAPCDVNDAFFKQWLGGKAPAHVTLIPLKVNHEVIAVLMGTAQKDPQSKDTLDFAQDIGAKMIEVLSQQVDQIAA